jgi:hypothetical protein
MLVLGIDAGLRGYCCFINEKLELEFHKNPIIGNEIDCLEFHNLLNRLRPDKVFIERPQPRPLQGCRASLTSGKNFGIMIATIMLLKIPTITMDCSSWQKFAFLGIPSHLEPKVKSAMAAQKLFPNVDFKETPKCKKPHDGMCDASLISYYGLMSYGRN